MDLMKALTSQYMKQELPEVQVGDTVRVHVKICLLYTSPSPRDCS